MILTYRFRIKDKQTSTVLSGMARDVNFVWNYANNVVRTRWKESRKYTDKKLLHTLTAGSSKELSINSQTVQAVYEELLDSVKQFKKQIRFRSMRKSLGWIPIKGQTFRFLGNYAVYDKKKFRIWYHRELPPNAKIKTGSFAQDARGRWYLNLQVEAEHSLPEASGDVGIDLGLKTQATLSDGTKYDRENLTRKYEERLAKAQRFRKKRLAKKIHAKIKNKRLDADHKASFDIAKEYKNVFVGDVDSSKLKKTKMAKSVSDASWFQLKTLLSYKTMRRQGKCIEVSERFSTVTCSSCLQKTGPSGLSGLRIREWTCGCGASHDRDVNAAQNILRLGRETLICEQLRA